MKKHFKTLAIAMICITMALFVSCKKNTISTDKYVDLGLPSGLLWATCNVGANSPEDYGDYFAWGETKTKSDYTWATYKWLNSSNNKLKKYNNDSSYGTADDKTELKPSDDAAHVQWGGDWRMPKLSEWDELYNNTTVIMTTQNGVCGLLFTSNVIGYTDKTLFLPAAGYRCAASLVDANTNCYYWSSSLYTTYPYSAYGMNSQDYILRNNGFSVRAVK